MKSVRHLIWSQRLSAHRERVWSYPGSFLSPVETRIEALIGSNKICVVYSGSIAPWLLLWPERVKEGIRSRIREAVDEIG